MLTAAQFQQWCLRLHLAPEAGEVVMRVRSSPPTRRVGSQANKEYDAWFRSFKFKHLP